MPIDKYGKCPNCETDWNKGDIHKVLSNINMFAHKTDYDISKIAQNYGWTEFNKGNFSSLKLIEVEDKKIAQCSNIRCGHFFDLETGNEFVNLLDAYNNINKVERE